MAETNANWDEHLPGAGSDLGAAHGQEEREASTSVLPWRGGREILAQQKSCLCSWVAEPALTMVNC